MGKYLQERRHGNIMDGVLMVTIYFTMSLCGATEVIPHNWNAQSIISYSLYNFYGTTMTIKDCLLSSISGQEVQFR